MKRISLMLGVILLVMLFSGSAFAGLKQTLPVIVTNSVFMGSIGTARNSADNTQFIACRDHGSFATCSARNSTGTTKSCTTTNATYLAVIRGMDDSSYLSTKFDSRGTCIGMNYAINSVLEPKQP